MDVVKLWMEQLGFRSKRSFGLDQLDLELAKYITFSGGFFVEAGGNDGLAQSNTAYFERYFGWRGLLIEPIPDLAAKCRRNRPHSQVETCALVPFDFDCPNVTMTYCNLMSLVEGARGSADADQAHIATGKQFLGDQDPPYILEVPARTLTDVLVSHEVKKIDLLSLDVEGFEGPVLQGLDFSRYSPTWIVVETNDLLAVETVLLPRYEFVAAVSVRDRLYRLK